MEAEQLSAGCKRRQAHRVMHASAQIALRLREFVRLAESARHCCEPTVRGAPSVVGAFLSVSFAEYARQCGETAERGSPSVVGALLSGSFAEYARPWVELAERVWRLHAVLRLFLRLVFVFIFIFWCNLMCFVHIYLAERLKSPI